MVFQSRPSVPGLRPLGRPGNEDGSPEKTVVFVPLGVGYDPMKRLEPNVILWQKAVWMRCGCSDWKQTGKRVSLSPLDIERNA
jgi:hypothetical protein